MTKIKEFTYQDGDFVVYPTHGVGKILGTEKSQIAGMDVQLMVIRFEQDRMTLRVPLEKARTLGLRTLSSRKHMDDAITTLKSKAKIRRTMWSRRSRASPQTAQAAMSPGASVKNISTLGGLVREAQLCSFLRGWRRVLYIRCRRMRMQCMQRLPVSPIGSTVSQLLIEYQTAANLLLGLHYFV